MNKMIYLIIAIAALGIIILPETMALFQNQHTFYVNNSVPCGKCHADVATQMTGINTPHSDMSCANCHTINMVENGAHAATLPLCINCHNGNMTPNGQIKAHELGIMTNCVKCHDGQSTQMQTGLNIQTEITNPSEAHRGFITDANNNTMMQGSNEACIGCHTAVNVNITWNKPTTMKITVNSNGVSNFSIME